MGIDLTVATPFLEFPKPRCARCGHDVELLEITRDVHGSLRILAGCHGAFEESVITEADMTRWLREDWRLSAVGDAFVEVKALPEATESRLSVGGITDADEGRPSRGGQPHKGRPRLRRA
jgi:hypothetical protein